MTQEAVPIERTAEKFPAALFRGPTVEEALAANGGFGPGFDTLRLILSLAVLLSHAILLSNGEAWFEKMPVMLTTLRLMIVPVFFALGGFLVTASALRLRAVGPFLAFRTLRIFPALAVEVTLSAFILGAIFTKLPLGAYFTHPELWHYFGNIIGLIQFTLPGVFYDNPHYAGWVNPSLWTLKPDYYSYLLMAVLMLTRLIYNRTVFSVLFLAVTAVLFTLDITQGLGEPTLVVPMWSLVYYFYAGVFAFHWRDKIVLNGWLCLLAVVITCLSSGRLWSYVLSIPVVYVMVYGGMSRIPTPNFLKRTDFSYGIYLYNCPILAAIVAATSNRFTWYELFAIGVILTGTFAMLSWKFIERPSLDLKRLFAPTKTLPRP